MQPFLQNRIRAQVCPPKTGLRLALPAIEPVMPCEKPLAIEPDRAQRIGHPVGLIQETLATLQERKRARIAGPKALEVDVIVPIVKGQAEKGQIATGQGTMGRVVTARNADSRMRNLPVAPLDR